MLRGGERSSPEVVAKERRRREGRRKPDFATRHKMRRIRRRPEDIFDKLIAMPTYSKGDFERIAAAIGVDVAHVAHYAQSFEAAATWYRLDREGAKNKRSPTAVTKKTLSMSALGG
jgi:uncharacterized protein YmfQ (DUF2313 family)